MRISLNNAVLGLVVAFATSSAYGQFDLSWVGGGNQVTFDGSFRDVDSRALAEDSTLLGAQTFDMIIDTEADIHLVDASLRVTKGTWFNVANFGSDTNPPFFAIFWLPPLLYADSWVTTPNASTGAAGPNRLDTAGTIVTHFDPSDDGPQTNFRFASITIIPDQEGMIEATLTGTIQTAADPTPVFDDFVYTMGVPEPTSMGLILSALLGGFAIVRRKRN